MTAERPGWGLPLGAATREIGWVNRFKGGTSEASEGGTGHEDRTGRDRAGAGPRLSPPESSHMIGSGAANFPLVRGTQPSFPGESSRIRDPSLQLSTPAGKFV